MPDVSVSAAFFVGVLVVLGAVIGGVGAAAKMLLPFVRKAGRVFDAWEGYEDPGTGQKRPGIVERMTHLEEASDETNRAIGKMADRLAGVEANAAAAASAVVAVGAESRERHDRLSEQVTEVDRKVDEVTQQTQMLAAEQTQIRQALDEMRQRGASE